MDLRKVLLLRKEKESFHWFIDTIASAVVGTAVAEKMKYLSHLESGYHEVWKHLHCCVWKTIGIW